MDVLTPKLTQQIGVTEVLYKNLIFSVHSKSYYSVIGPLKECETCSWNRSYGLMVYLFKEAEMSLNFAFTFTW